MEYYNIILQFQDELQRDIYDIDQLIKKDKKHIETMIDTSTKKLNSIEPTAALTMSLESLNDLISQHNINLTEKESTERILEMSKTVLYVYRQEPDIDDVNPTAKILKNLNNVIEHITINIQDNLKFYKNHDLKHPNLFTKHDTDISIQISELKTYVQAKKKLERLIEKNE